MQKVNRKKLVQMLEVLKPGVTPKEVVEQSNCYVFWSGACYTFNNEVFCCQKTEFDLEGALPGKQMLELLRDIKEDDLQMDEKEDEVIFRTRDGKVGIKKHKGGVASHIKELHWPLENEWSEIPSDFSDSAKLVLGCASDDKKREDLRCVHFTDKFIEACDGVQVCRVGLDLDIQRDFLVEVKNLEAVISVDNDEICLSDGWVHFRGPITGLMMSCRRYMDGYPDLSVFLKGKGTSEVQLPRSTKDTAELLRKIADENSDNKRVNVTLRKGKMLVEARGHFAWSEQTKDIEYDGEPVSFQIYPKVLKHLVECEDAITLDSNRMIVRGSNYKFVASLAQGVPS